MTMVAFRLAVATQFLGYECRHLAYEWLNHSDKAIKLVLFCHDLTNTNICVLSRGSECESTFKMNLGELGFNSIIRREEKIVGGGTYQISSWTDSFFFPLHFVIYYNIFSGIYSHKLLTRWNTLYWKCLYLLFASLQAHPGEHLIQKAHITENPKSWISRLTCIFFKMSEADSTRDTFIHSQLCHYQGMNINWNQNSRSKSKILCSQCPPNIQKPGLTDVHRFTTDDVQEIIKILPSEEGNNSLLLATANNDHKL